VKEAIPGAEHFSSDCGLPVVRETRLDHGGTPHLDLR